MGKNVRSNKWQTLVKPLYKDIKHNQGYYIHHYYKNISRIKNGKDWGEAYSSSELVDAFKSEKENAAQLIRTQYIELFDLSTDESIDFVNLLLNNNRGDEILDAINEGIAIDLKNGLNVEKLSKVIKLKEDIPSLNKSQNKILSEYLKSDTITEGAEYLNNYIMAIVKGCNILGINEKNYAFLDGLSTLANNSKLSSSEYGKELLKIAKKMANANEYQTITSQKLKQMQDVANAIDSIGYALVNKKFKSSKNQIGIEGLRTAVQNNFLSTVIGEWAGLSVKRSAELTCLKTLGKGLHSGDKQEYDLYFVNANGQYQKATPQMINSMSTASSGKADMVREGVSISFETLPGLQNGLEFKMDLGISQKAYKNVNTIPENKSKKNKNEVDFGGGMNARLAIDMAFQSEEKKYLAYNTFAWSNSKMDKEPLYALQDVIFKRSFMNLIGSRGLNQNGKSDFASMIMINGKIIPLWDLVKYAMKNDIGKSGSLNPNSPLVFSIDKGGARKNMTINENDPNLIMRYDKTAHQKGQSEKYYGTMVAKIMRNRMNFMYTGLGKSKLSAALRMNKLKDLGSTVL